MRVTQGLRNAIRTECERYEPGRIRIEVGNRIDNTTPGLDWSSDKSFNRLLLAHDDDVFETIPLRYVKDIPLTDDGRAEIDCYVYDWQELRTNVYVRIVGGRVVESAEAGEEWSPSLNP